MPPQGAGRYFKDSNKLISAVPKVEKDERKEVLVCLLLLDVMYAVALPTRAGVTVGPGWVEADSFFNI
jgi:hypothetical protein